jgi:hypothetical protein
MQAITLCVIVVAGAVVVGAKARTSFLVYLLVLLYYPQYVTVQVGTIDFTSARFLVLLLTLRLALRGQHIRQFRWSILDSLVLAAWAGQTAAAFTTTPAMIVMERQGGSFFDMVLTYFAGRLIIRTPEDFHFFLRAVVVAAAPLALIGFYQALTGNNPYDVFRQHAAWAGTEQEMLIRRGLFRADASFGNYIAFGMFYAVAIPFALAVWRHPDWPASVSVVTMGALLLGLIASMSSGPIASLVCAAAFICCYPYRHLWPFIALSLLLTLLFLELYSDRHFYHVITRIAYNTSTAYYRIELYEEALGGGMAGRWLTGFGYVGFRAEDWIHNVRSGFDWQHKDLTSIYIGYLARYGLLGVLPFLAATIAFYTELLRAGKYALLPMDRWALWCFAGGVLGWNIGMMTVGALQQTMNMLFIFLGICASLRPAFREEWLVYADTDTAPATRLRLGPAPALRPAGAEGSRS